MATMCQLCTFALNHNWFAVPVNDVQEVLRSLDVTRVPLAAKAVSGLINLRGQIVPAIDLRTRLELPARNDGGLSMNIVVRTGDGPKALLVDEIGDVLDLHEEALESPPQTLRGPARDLIRGTLKLQSSLVHLLDVSRCTTNN
jgi:purine-binding chemotaxis protein CheW